MLTLDLPYPPSVNNYYRHVGYRTLISREGRAFRRRVCSILSAGGCRPMEGALEMSLELYPPDGRRRDVDNVMKALLDALQHGGLYRNDSQIVRLVAEKKSPTPGGKVVVRLQPLRPS